MIFIHGIDISIQLSTASRDFLQWADAQRANVLIQEQSPMPPESVRETGEGVPGGG